MGKPVSNWEADTTVEQFGVEACIDGEFFTTRM